MSAAAAVRRPKISVCMISYNHADFIVQAVDSVFAQQVEADIELVVGDDASKDSTPALLQQCVEKYPGRIKLRLNAANVGMMANLCQTLSECDGDYIAMLEGDDYWSDPQKLARQVGFMESHPDFALCFHPVRIAEDGGFTEDRFTRDVPAVTTIHDLAEGNYMHTCSVLYRAGLVPQFPESFSRSTVGDYFLHMLYARHGSICRLPQVMAVYRVHAGGVWSSHHGIEKKVLRYLECMIGCFDEPINQVLIARYQRIAVRVLFTELDSSAGAGADEENLARVLAYGSAPLLAKLRALSAENRQARNTLLRRVLGALRRVIRGPQP